MQTSVLLASASPRRAQLLSQLGITFSTVATNIDESAIAGEAPVEQAVRLAKQKAAKGLQDFCEAPAKTLVIASDTLIEINGKSFGKPDSYDHFKHMMTELSDNVHHVITAVCLKSLAYENSVSVTTRVWFAPMSDKDILHYWQTGEPQDKAGGYAIQGIGGQFVRRIDGSVSAVIGLPLFETKQLLLQAGVL